MAHGCPQYSQKWCHEITGTGPRWELNTGQPDLQVVLEAAKYERPASANTPRRDITASYLKPVAALQPKYAKPLKPTQSRCKPKEKRTGSKGSSDDGSSSEHNPDHSPTPKPREPTKGHSRQPGSYNHQDHQVPSKPQGEPRKRAYCSQDCLKGLSEGTAMDSSCPNFADHPMHEHSYQHALPRSQVAQLLREQLAESFDHCTDLQQRGRTGMLFQVTLESHGYTFVAKGSVRGFISSSKKEEKVYRLLEKRQGRSIPVYLGSIDLDVPWIESAFDIVHMLLLSWAGEVVWWNIARDKAGEAFIWKQKQRFEREYIKMGICHTDVEYRNILWNAETKQLMFIDFDQTIVFDLHCPPESVTRGTLYPEVFRSQKQNAAIKYLAKREKAALAKLSRQTQSRSIRFDRSNKINASHVGMDINFSDIRPALIPDWLFAKIPMAVEQNPNPRNLIPDWLFADEQAAFVGIENRLAVAANPDAFPPFSRITTTTSAPSRPRMPVAGATKPACGVSGGQGQSSWLLNRDRYRGNLPILYRPVDGISTKKSEGLPFQTKQVGTATLNDENKDNEPVDDPMEEVAS